MNLPVASEEKEHLHGTVEKGSLPMLQLKMLQARLTMSTT